MTICKTLGNGLTALIQENRFAPVVSMNVWVQVGSADETEKEAGLAHVHEHMIFKGTKKRQVGEIAKEVEGAGGDINAYTSFNQTVYYITMASRYMDTGLDVLADAVINASFDAEELSKELQVILEEVKRYNDIPSSKLSTELFKTAFTKHPFRRPIIGFEDTIRGFKREDILDFYGRYYAPGNIIFSIVGDFDENEVLKKVEDAFGKMPAGKAEKPVRPDEPKQTELRSFLLTEPISESFMDMAFHIPGLLHDDAPALDLLGVILGNGESSRLYRKIRSEKQLVHSVWSYAYTPLDTGIFFVGSALSADKSEDALQAILQEVYNSRNGLITEEELLKAKRTVEADFIFERETVQGQARRFGFFWSVAKDLDFEKKYLKRVLDVSLSDLARVSSTYLRTENLSLGLLVPREWKDKLTREQIHEAALSVSAPEAKSLPTTKPLVDTGNDVKPVQADYVNDRIESEGISRITLKNGLRLLFRKNEAVPLVSMRAICLGGTRYETEATQGISHFMSDMITKGTITRDAHSLAVEIEMLGGSLKGFSGRNTFGASADFLARDFAKGMELMADVLRNPSFDSSELEKKRADIQFMISKRKDELARSVFDMFTEQLFPEHPYRFSTLGTSDTIKNITQQQLVDYHQQYAVPGNLVLSIVGDISEEEAVAQVQQWFGDMPETSFAPLVFSPQKEAGEIRRAEIQREKEQAHLMIGFLGATMTDPDRYPLEVLNSILAGQGGRLFMKLRDEMNLAYSVAPFTAEGIETGYFCVYIGTSPTNVDVATENILDQLNIIRDEPVPVEELERAKRYMIGTYETELQTNSAQNANFGFAEIYGLGFDNYKKYPERVKAVTVEDVQRVAKRFLKTDRYTMALIRPKEE